MPTALWYTAAFHILLISRKIKFFPSSLCYKQLSDVGVKSKGNIQECSHTEMCLEHSPLLFILPRRFNKSIFAKVFRHESIQENPIGDSCSMHSCLDLEYPILLALCDFLGIRCRLDLVAIFLFIGKLKLKNTKDMVR